MAAASPDKRMLYKKLMATKPLVECRGATVPYTSLFEDRKSRGQE
jgi:hypothetical protein